jgi:hypothetical protein
MPDAALLDRVGDMLGKRPVSWRRTTGGYSRAHRWIVGFEDASSCFMKAGASEFTAGAIRAEFDKVYSQIDAEFLAGVIAYEDDAASPLLLLEDLSRGHWPPPWSAKHVRQVLDALSLVHAIEPPSPLQAFDREKWLDEASWRTVGPDPLPFLSLGLCTEGWLNRALPVLMDAADNALCDGNSFLHLDVRSDNLCLLGTRTVLVDWNWATTGNALLDAAFWLPSLSAEGGPIPEAVMPGQPELASSYPGTSRRKPACRQSPRLLESGRSSSLSCGMRFRGRFARWGCRRLMGRTREFTCWRVDRLYHGPRAAGARLRIADALLRLFEGDMGGHPPCRRQRCCALWTPALRRRMGSHGQRRALTGSAKRSRRGSVTSRLPHFLQVDQRWSVLETSAEQVVAGFDGAGMQQQPFLQSLLYVEVQIAQYGS